VGSGCSEYQFRPPGCEDFECQWLKKNFGAEEHRPDKEGVMVDYAPFLERRKNLQFYFLWELKPNALRRNFAKGVASVAIRSGAPVFVNRLSGLNTLADELSDLKQMGISVYPRTSVAAVQQLL
jgi:hypothetical protein